MINSYDSNGMNAPSQVASPANYNASSTAYDFANQALGKKVIDNKFVQLNNIFADADQKTNADGQKAYSQQTVVDAQSGETTTTIEMGGGRQIVKKNIPGESTTYEAHCPTRDGGEDNVAVMLKSDGSEGMSQWNTNPNGRSTMNAENIKADGQTRHFYNATPAYNTNSSALGTPNADTASRIQQFMVDNQNAQIINAVKAGKLSKAGFEGLSHDLNAPQPGVGGEVGGSDEAQAAALGRQIAADRNRSLSLLNKYLQDGQPDQKIDSQEARHWDNEYDQLASLPTEEGLALLRGQN